MSRFVSVCAVLALVAFASPASAQPAKTGKLPAKFAQYADVQVEVSPAKAKRGETVIVKLSLTPKAGGITYPAFPSDSSQNSKNDLTPPKPGDLIFIGKIADPQVAWKKKPREGGTGLEEDEYTDKPLVWEMKAVVSPSATPGAKSILLDTLRLQVCDAKQCYPADGDFLPPAEFVVEDGIATNVKSEDLLAATQIWVKAQSVKPTPPANPGTTPQPPTPPANAKTPTRKTAIPVEQYKQEMKSLATNVVRDENVTGNAVENKQTGLWSFVLTAAAWGLISLVTPCVFPMIPITVSIFMKQAHGSFRERLKLAGVYSITIILVLGISAFALLKFMAWLSVHPVTNVLLGLLFIVLALSLFGMYELSLPNSLQKRLQARQAKGGTVGTIFGALAFTVISFTCVAPFLGGFAGISAGNEASGSMIALPTARELAGGFAFATAFAAPFFLLALLPGLLKALPKSGGWLDSVKVVMGFLELAAALKFLRTAELGVLSPPQYFTFDVVLGGWIAMSLACSLYLLNLYRLPHDEEQPHIGVPRLLFALAFLGLSLYLLPAMFKNNEGKPQRPAGTVYAWVESFLLPEASEGVATTDLKAAVATSRASGKPVFVDFTGVTCTNCKYNEESVFPTSAVRSELEKFEMVQLYTDWVPEQFYTNAPELAERKLEARVNRDFQIEVFKDVKLPLYAVMMPEADGKIRLVGVYDEGKINNPAQFAKFLRTSYDRAKKK